jgi:predicted lipoprotein with Yx(FWY)xxD motif
MRTRTTYMGVVLAVLGALVIAGCGGGSSSSSSGSSSTPEASGGESASATTSSEGGGSSTIAGAEVGGLGEVLANSEGMTVYLYTPDTGTTSTCYGGCETEWPPVVAEGKPSAGEGAMSTALGTTKRKDGTMQVTYEGHPVYLFAGDKAPGEANGQGDDGVWWVMNEAGEAIESGGSGGGDSSTTTESTTTPAGSGGGGY